MKTIILSDEQCARLSAILTEMETIEERSRSGAGAWHREAASLLVEAIQIFGAQGIAKAFENVSKRYT